MSRISLVAAGLCAALLAGCGGGTSTTPSAPSAVAPSAPPTPQPTPRPGPTPTPDPRLQLAPGPVARFAIKVRTINNGERDAVPDDQGRFIVHPGERADFDSTQKNAGDQICQWVNDPVWLIDGHNVPLESDAGIVYRRGSSQPFLLKLTIQKTGVFEVQGAIDGVSSNVLVMKSQQ
jgi:hypothetical protein